ncbi:MAG: hypothetical protein Q9163_005897 [Psora crenata]
MPLAPLMLRMPYVLSAPGTFSTTETLHKAVDNLTDSDPDQPQSSRAAYLLQPPASMHLLNPTSSPALEEGGQQWKVNDTNYVLEFILIDTPLDKDEVIRCLQNAIMEISQKPSAQALQGTWHSGTHDKVVLSMHSKFFLWGQLKKIVGHRGLEGYFAMPERNFTETFFYVRDNGPLGGGRRVAFGQVKKGMARSIEGDGLREVGDRRAIGLETSEGMEARRTGRDSG